MKSILQVVILLPVFILQNELVTYLWYLNLGYTLRDLEVIQKFNNDNNSDKDQYRY